jgi:sec-independent protein translocase protein TatB
MFDVNFAELLVIFVVALIVLGPTRLPGLVTKVGRWVGKARTMARQFREQLENEVNLEELNRMTEAQTRASKTPPPPPGFNGAHRCGS